MKKLLGQRPAKNGSLILALLTALIGGCVVTVSFNPRGSSVSISGDWQVNGQVPTASACEALGIDEVEFRIFDSVGIDFYSSADLRFPCTAGSFSAPNYLRHGLFRYQWIAFDKTGNVVGEVARQELDVRTITDYKVATPNFYEGMMMNTNHTLQVQGTWERGYMSNNLGTCAEAGVASVDYVLTQNGSPIESTRKTGVACATAFTITNVTSGEYGFEINGYLADGTQVYQSECAGLVVGNNDAGFECEFTEIAPETTVNLKWNGQSCEQLGANAPTWLFILKDAANAQVATQTNLSCSNELVVENVPDGDYTLTVSGDAANNDKYGSDCTGIPAGRGIRAVLCDIPIVR